eukprot:Hpha_TRINITY_DN15374_c1_g1::TRINITY_DN15374_c1_g1_i5::g.90686::m.90686
MAFLFVQSTPTAPVFAGQVMPAMPNMVNAFPAMNTMVAVTVPQPLPFPPVMSTLHGSALQAPTMQGPALQNVGVPLIAATVPMLPGAVPAAVPTALRAVQASEQPLPPRAEAVEASACGSACRSECRGHESFERHPINGRRIQRSGLPEYPPCAHNCWVDLRTRNNRKILRCATCAQKWRFDRSSPKYVRCLSFTLGECLRGDECPHLHIIFSSSLRAKAVSEAS